MADPRGREGHAPRVQILSILCSFWENLAKLHVGTPRGLAPPPRGNPGSATVYYDVYSAIHKAAGLMVPGCSMILPGTIPKIPISREWRQRLERPPDESG